MNNVKLVAWGTGIFFLLMLDFGAVKIVAPYLISSSDWALFGLGVLLSLFLVWVHLVVVLVLINKFWKEMEDKLKSSLSEYIRHYLMKSGTIINIDQKYVDDHLGDLVSSKNDLSKFIFDIKIFIIDILITKYNNVDINNKPKFLNYLSRISNKINKRSQSLFR